MKNLPKDMYEEVMIKTGEEQPSDNAKGFVAWLELYAVAGKGDLLSLID